MDVICINGEFLTLDRARVSATDGGLLRGEGAFETLRAESGQVLFASEHFARLSHGVRLLEIPWLLEKEALLAQCEQVLDANGLRDARLRITVTRGPVRSQPMAESEGEPTLIVTATAPDDRIDEARAAGWRVATAPYVRNERSPLCSFKSTSYAESMLARRYAVRNGFDEALLLNTRGFLAEASMANVFVVREGDVFTPRLEDGALPGVMRARVLSLCSAEGIEAHEAPVAMEDLYSASEAFLTNASIQIVPAVQAGERMVGDGHAGPVTTALYQAHRRGVERIVNAAREG